jgi:hypothetical protein
VPRAIACTDGAASSLPVTFCGECGCATYNESPAFEPDGSWDGKRRIVAVNARLLDDFVADDAPVTVIDGKNRWSSRAYFK